jgi:LemA protein
MTIIYVLVGFAVILGLFLMIVIGMYNKLVKGRNYFKNSFAQIDVQLKRRYDLIPNLVETAKGFMKHEKETLEAVIKARNGAVSASSKAASDPSDPSAIKNLAAAEGMLTGAVGKFFALSESYPELKSDTHMTGIMEELTATENKISFARQAFNDSVTSYNNSRETFPTVIIANMFGFNHAELLEVIEAPEERNAVKVSF